VAKGDVRDRLQHTADQQAKAEVAVAAATATELASRSEYVLFESFAARRLCVHACMQRGFLSVLT
jgi:hypothetical protein